MKPIAWSLRARAGSVEFEAEVPDESQAGFEHALDVLQRSRATLALQIPESAVSAEESGVRVALPGGALSPAIMSRVAAALTPLASAFLASIGAGTIELRPHREGVEARFGLPLLPEVYAALAPTMAAALFVACRDFLWDDLPADIAAAAIGIGPLAADVASEVEALGAGGYRVAARGEGVDVDRSDVAEARATQLWALLRRCGPRLRKTMSRGLLDRMQRMLPVLASAQISTEPGEPPSTEPSVATAAAAASDVPGAIEIRPFRAGGRPLDDLLQPGSGCSEFGGFLSSSGEVDVEDEGLWILFGLADMEGVDPAQIEVRMSAWFLPHVGQSGGPVEVPGLGGVTVPPRVVGATDDVQPRLETATYESPTPRSFVAQIVPQTQLFPGDVWSWDDLPQSFRDQVPDGEDPYTFSCLFHRQVRVRLTLFVAGVPRGYSVVEVEVYDAQRFGSLYGRLLELIAKDTRAVATAIGRADLYTAYHPWYPVLAIGMNKAAFYMKAILGDLANQTKHLRNPRWLLHVGLYLEFLTCVGIFEVVRGEFPDLLTAAERRCLEEAPQLKPVRDGIDRRAWREVWALHEIVPKGFLPLAAGPVSFKNLLKKQDTTLAFLHAHHEDLFNAIELAGPDLHGSQETWHRVYRDAERAVVSSSLAAFPELRYVPARYQDFVLWHEKGNFNAIAGGRLVPKWITSLFGDQDGVYPSGARKYRESMNDIALRAKDRGLMDFVGVECVPKSVSLIEAKLVGDDELFASLQAHDGYGGSLQAISESVRLRPEPNVKAVGAVLRGLPLLETLTDAEIAALAGATRRRACMPDEAVIVDGAVAEAVLVVESGKLDVWRGERRAARLQPGAVLAGRSCLAREPAVTSVRAPGYATLFEISREAFAQLAAARPALVDGLVESILLLGKAGRPVRGGDGVTARATRNELGRRLRSALVGEAAPHADALAEGRVEAIADHESVIPLLETVSIFQPLRPHEIEQLAKASARVDFHAGDRIVVEGDRGDSLFVIETGAVQVSRRGGGHTARLARLGPGKVFGEMALLTGERRTASVTAVDSVTVLEVEKDALFPIISQRPPVIVELTQLLRERKSETRASDKAQAADHGVGNRIRSFFFG